jgi:hypothetical protein
MLQCNRYPGLDANEIIRLTSAIGQLLLFSSPEQQPSKRPLYFGNCRKIDSHKSSNAAIGAFAANDSIRLDWSAAISSQVGWLGRPLGSLG